VDKLAGAINGISTFMTGNYYSVTMLGDWANVGGFPLQSVNRSCDGNLSHSDRTINRCFDVSCFSLTPLGRFGNSGRNIIQIPCLNNCDIALMKDMRFTERVRSQLRFEFFNIFNHPQYNTPDLTVGDALFDAIRSARDGRISQAALEILW
jgi:hypothetical protein